MCYKYYKSDDSYRLYDLYRLIAKISMNHSITSTINHLVNMIKYISAA